MNPPDQSTSEFLLLFHNTDWHRDLSPEEIQDTMSRWMDWFNGLVADGKCLGGHPLLDTGKVVSGKDGTVSDGPFNESKEAIGGYFFLRVESFEEALAIAKNCPGLPHGIQVEVRAVAPNCAANRAAMMDEPAVAAV